MKFIHLHAIFVLKKILVVAVCRDAIVLISPCQCFTVNTSVWNQFQYKKKKCFIINDDFKVGNTWILHYFSSLTEFYEAQFIVAFFAAVCFKYCHGNAFLPTSGCSHSNNISFLLCYLSQKKKNRPSSERIKANKAVSRKFCFDVNMRNTKNITRKQSLFYKLNYRIPATVGNLFHSSFFKNKHVVKSRTTVAGYSVIT